MTFKPGPISSADPAPEIFKQFRARFDLTQPDASGLFGVSIATWAAWEQNQRPQAAARMLAALLLAKPELIEFFLEKDG